jgi:hypothetical protein
VGRVGAGEEEHALESERPEHVAGKRDMAPMNRIEGAAEYAD